MPVFVPWGRRRSSIFDLSHIGGLSPNPTIPLLVSPQVLYALQNVALVEIADPNRYAVDLVVGGYYRVEPSDSADYALFLDVVNQTGLQLSDYLTMSTLWNFQQQFSEDVFVADAQAGENSLYVYGPGADAVIVIDTVSVYNVNTGSAPTFVRAGPEGAELYIYAYPTLTAGIPAAAQGPWHLTGSDRIQARFFGCTAGDELHLQVTGYVMELLV